MSTDEFERKMKEISKNNDIEVRHSDADKLICQLLIELGYDEGVKIFRKMEKWYS